MIATLTRSRITLAGIGLVLLVVMVVARGRPDVRGTVSPTPVAIVPGVPVVASPAPPAPHVETPEEREAMCRELTNGKQSCAELEPELVKLRASTDAYLKRQSERMHQIWIAKDPASTPEQRRIACADLAGDPITESISVGIPAECSGGTSLQFSESCPDGACGAWLERRTDEDSR